MEQDNKRDAPALPFTGERFIPGIEGEIWIEHWHRYHYAATLAANKRVLDVACGEGYGSALLGSIAASVAGVDIAEAAVQHARQAYRGRQNLSFHNASCCELPFADDSFDVVISFETVEHIAEQSAFIAEIDRVLAPGGMLVMSSPNKAEYTDRRQFDNTFHVRELYRNEFESLLAERFGAVRWLGQKNGFFSVIWEESPRQNMAGQVIDTAKDTPEDVLGVLLAPLYFVVIAARAERDIAAIASPLSVFSDRREWLYEDYRRVTRELRDAQAEIARLQSLTR
jgi:ubiquinone/menaquinone biosynthesis C-methylase UbiE